MTREEKEKLIRHLKYNREIGADYLITDEDTDEIIKALEQEPCGDAISRQAVLDAIMANCIWENEYNLTSSSIKKAVESLPPVNPQPKTGHWIDGKCDRCGTHAPYWAMATTYYCSEYCPNCGAKMESGV